MRKVDIDQALIRELTTTEGSVSIAGATSGPWRRRRFHSFAETSAPSSRTSSCFPIAPSMTTSPMRCR